MTFAVKPIRKLFQITIKIRSYLIPNKIMSHSFQIYMHILMAVRQLNKNRVYQQKLKRVKWPSFSFSISKSNVRRERMMIKLNTQYLLINKNDSLTFVLIYSGVVNFVLCSPYQGGTFSRYISTIKWTTFYTYIGYLCFPLIVDG